MLLISTACCYYGVTCPRSLYHLNNKIKWVFRIYLTFAFFVHVSQVVPLSKQSLHVTLDLSA